jgi:hypothetical protein
LDEIPEAAAAAIAGEVEVVTEDVKVNMTNFINKYLAERWTERETDRLTD